MNPQKVSWNPDQYLKFGDQRLRPAQDLLARVGLESPGIIYDLGCGTGNTTQLLVDRWPQSQVTGIDSSSEMLEKARNSCPNLDFKEADLEDWNPGIEADLFYSNAALHWLGNHETLFPRLLKMLPKGGRLAVQMPRNFESPSHTAIRESVESGPWAKRIKPALRSRPVLEPEFYYDLLANQVEHLDLWETIYTHVLEGENPVVEWTKGTALRPILKLLQAEEETTFMEDYSKRIHELYPPRNDGRTLFPFRRLFIVATR